MNAWVAIGGMVRTAPAVVPGRRRRRLANRTPIVCGDGVALTRLNSFTEKSGKKLLLGYLTSLVRGKICLKKLLKISGKRLDYGDLFLIFRGGSS